MLAHLQTDSDCWHGVQDPKKRKQIQDRLAQRARRKRRAESSQALALRGAQEDIPTDAFAVTIIELPFNTSPASLDSSASPASCPSFGSELSIGVDHSLLTKHVSSVFAALFNNGRILGIPCGIQVPILSRPCTAKTPLSLHPTQSQMTVLHIPWIDRFPFPKMRDNVIQLSGIIDEEVFLCDLFTTDSFTIVPGSVSWDPMAWVVTNPFEKKWGYLFY
ncbi:hypothetical protein W97_02371 [Coniosporium apollinis CBS 100218]|uniref:BZIP domain-containing protein n=1 Tax=Coniosporium apollinis (strain CBS 100218) TaxID=1168221 RepID=R7YMX3_CONA1|nr:uncharacterized protein W97_02371 [Coniosporium apollinis CBS 100218]EON63144.1 hypothetical protein W97_02371 [Coniosporium apollinis CBS 100218]